MYINRVLLASCLNQLIYHLFSCLVMKFAFALVAGLATASAEPLTNLGRSAKPIKVTLNNWWDGTDYQWYGKISVGTPGQAL